MYNIPHVQVPDTFRQHIIDLGSDSDQMPVSFRPCNAVSQAGVSAQCNAVSQAGGSAPF